MKPLPAHKPPLQAAAKPPAGQAPKYAHRLTALCCALQQRCRQQVDLVAQRRTDRVLDRQRDKATANHAPQDQLVNALLGFTAGAATPKAQLVTPAAAAMNASLSVSAFSNSFAVTTSTAGAVQSATGSPAASGLDSPQSPQSVPAINVKSRTLFELFKVCNMASESMFTLLNCYERRVT